jgi:hypothetical protein
MTSEIPTLTAYPIMPRSALREMRAPGGSLT